MFDDFFVDHVWFHQLEEAPHLEHEGILGRKAPDQIREAGKKVVEDVDELEDVLGDGGVEKGVDRSLEGAETGDERDASGMIPRVKLVDHLCPHAVADKDRPFDLERIHHRFQILDQGIHRVVFSDSRRLRSAMAAVIPGDHLMLLFQVFLDIGEVEGRTTEAVATDDRDPLPHRTVGDLCPILTVGPSFNGF